MTTAGLAFFLPDADEPLSFGADDNDFFFAFFLLLLLLLDYFCLLFFLGDDDDFVLALLKASIASSNLPWSFKASPMLLYASALSGLIAIALL